MPETFEAKLRAENPDLLAPLVELLGPGFTFRDGHEYDMALEWASRAFHAGREAAAQAIQDHADRHAPRGSGGSFRRHLLAAARIALGPLSRQEAAKAFGAAVAKLKDESDD